MKKVDFLTQTQIKSLVDGGSMFFEIAPKDYLIDCVKDKNEYIRLYAKLQIGDEFYVQEKCFYLDEELHFNNIYTERGQEQHRLDYDVFLCNENQSRVKGKIKNVGLVKVQDLFNNLDTEKEYYDLLEKFNVKTFGGGQIADTGDYGDYWFTIGEPIESEDGMYILNSWENEETLDMFIIDYYSKNGTYNDNSYIILYEIS